MPTTVDVFPDAEAAASIHLRAQGIASGRVYSSIPSDAVYPLVRIQRVGGLPVTRMRLDAADLQFDVYGQSKSQARLLAAQTRAAMYLLEASEVSIPSGNAYVTGVTDVMAATWMPDSSNVTTSRYVFTMRVFLHAA